MEDGASIGENLQNMGILFGNVFPVRDVASCVPESLKPDVFLDTDRQTMQGADGLASLLEIDRKSVV